MASSRLSLTEEQQMELSSIAQSRSLPAGYVFRAKLILMLAERASFNTIKRRLQTSAPTIIRWKQRFLQSGLHGLDTYHPGQRATVLTPALRARILSSTRKKPSDGSTHWSCRKLAAALGIRKDAVHRVWKESGLKPHRLERYLASDDPEFETKAADILGLYLRPPQHAAVFCVDEKTAIQALDRKDPVLPLSPGRAERHGFEYFRHGTLSLYAAFNTKTGEVLGKTAARHTSAEFVAFLTDIPKTVVVMVGFSFFITSFAIGVGGTGWLIQGEVFPTAVRGRAAAIAACVDWLANYALIEAFPVWHNAIGLAWVMVCFAVLCVLAIGFVYKFLPETKGLSVEQAVHVFEHQAEESSLPV